MWSMPKQGLDNVGEWFTAAGQSIDKRLYDIAEGNPEEGSLPYLWLV